MNLKPGITRKLKKVWNICARQKKTRSAEIIKTKSGWITEKVIQPDFVFGASAENRPLTQSAQTGNNTHYRKKDCHDCFLHLCFPPYSL